MIDFGNIEWLSRNLTIAIPYLRAHVGACSNACVSLSAPLFISSSSLLSEIAFCKISCTWKSVSVPSNFIFNVDSVPSSDIFFFIESEISISFLAYIFPCITNLFKCGLCDKILIIAVNKMSICDKLMPSSSFLAKYLSISSISMSCLK